MNFKRRSKMLKHVLNEAPPMKMRKVYRPSFRWLMWASHFYPVKVVVALLYMVVQLPLLLLGGMIVNLAEGISNLFRVSQFESLFRDLKYGDWS